MKKTYLLFLFLIFFLGACKDLNKNDIIGTWKSDNKTLFLFHNNNTFEVKNIPEAILFDNLSSNKLYSGTGNWELIYLENRWKIELSFGKYLDFSSYCCYLDIEKGFYSKKFLWKLYFYDGAQDTKYYLYRVNP